MSGSFLQEQLDYIRLVYGLSFALVAAASVATRDTGSRRLPWTWLVLFGLTHAIHEWLEIFVVSAGDGPFFSCVRMALLLVSYLFLLEFGREGVFRCGGRVPGRWMHIPLLLLVAGASLGGPASTNAAARYAVGLPGGLMSALALLRTARLEKASGGLRLCLAAVMAAYSLASGAIPERAPFFPASVINQESFLAWFGVPIQVVRAVLAIVLAAGVWVHHEQQRRLLLPASEVSRRSDSRRFVLVMSLLLLIGWHTTESVGRQSDRNARSSVLTQSAISAAAIDRNCVERLSGTVEDLQRPDYMRLREQLSLLSAAGARSGVRWTYLMFERGGRIGFLADSIPENVFGHTDPGVSYMQPPPQLLDVFRSGEAATVGPYADEYGAFVSGFFPVKSLTSGKVIAVLGMDVDAARWHQGVARYRGAAITVTLLVAILLVVFTITRGRLWESAQHLAANERGLSEAQKLARVGSWTYWAEENRSTWSDEMFRVWGRDPALGVPSFQEIRASVHRDDRHRFDAAVAGALRHGDGYEIEMRVLQPRGPARFVVARGAAERESTGRVVRIHGTLQDITERKEIERLKSEFVSTVSHELRTPLTAVRGSLGLLAAGVMGDMPPKAIPLIEMAVSNADRLIRLINDILDIEKIESGKMTFHMAPIDVSALLCEAVQANQAYAAQLGVTIVLEQECAGATVHGDFDRLLQVMTNLLSNAAKFSPRGGAVRVAASRAGGRVRVQVTDEGPGIPEEFRARIFQKFAQADTSSTREKGGTGLGLSICRAIIREHHGQIAFDSTEGAGTTFFFVLPEGGLYGSGDDAQEPTDPPTVPHQQGTAGNDRPMT